jgi:hypothetical protein
VTHFRTSVAALETDTPQLCATQLIARPGALPTITIPVAAGRTPGVDGIWRYLAEPAEFFGLAMPARTELEAALSSLPGGALVAASLLLADADGSPRILVSGTAVTPWVPDAVRIADADSAPQAHRATDPWWRRMAARTTSKGDLDQRRRWLNSRGYADGLSDGEPLLGALVFQTPSGTVGVENPEPTSVLDQLAQCGVFTSIDRAPTCPLDAERVWWVSPRFETHPVADLAGTPFPVDVEAVPSFARWS